MGVSELNEVINDVQYYHIDGNIAGPACPQPALFAKAVALSERMDL